MLDMWEAERAFIRWNIFETPHRHWLKTLGPNWVVMRRRYWKYTSRNWGQLGYCLVLQAIGLSASGCYGRERRTVIALIVMMGAKKWTGLSKDRMLWIAVGSRSTDTSHLIVSKNQHMIIGNHLIVSSKSRSHKSWIT